MADPITIQCASACTVTVEHVLRIPVLDLTIEEGQLIGGAIVLVWAIGYGFRVVARHIQSSGHNHQESE
ncbi:hypothetical protein [Variovorax sp. EBFNA2]|uniref:hypothetical protein n=1 Tax=Variovorax sp. EBFNA2 TaxID=3342097 RepID=UPI0029C0D233|nr:hypothetical protein [Variovorax boronicumulans]WPG40307.1 hypothetical protein RZE79_13445 [Variovorax boronicumulans]